MSAKPLILIDASGWLYRAFHALPPLTNSRNEPTGAIAGTNNMLRKLLREYAPELMCVVFDPKGGVFRNEMYAEYKANRTAIPEDLSAQFPAIVEMIGAMGLPMMTVQGVEADDVIGTLACEAQKAGMDVLIVTSDKDIAQLVSPRVKLLDTMKNVTLDEAGVAAKFGVPPERIVDYLALMGDTSDNIPGVPMVGPKTAAKWLAEHGTLDALMQNADKVGGKAGENLRASLAHLPLSRQLTTIKCDVELPVRVTDLALKAPDRERLGAFYRRYDLNRAYEESQREAGAEPAPAASAPPAAPPPSGQEPRPESPPTRHETVLDEAAFAHLLERLRAAPLICFDTETDQLDAMCARLVGLAFAVEPGHGWYLPLGHDYLGAPAQLAEAEVLARLKPILEDPDKPKIGQNLKYDLNLLSCHGIQVRGVAHDTMLQSYVLDATGRHDMDALAERHLNHRTISFADIAGKGRNQLTFNQVAIDQAAAYSAEDADITLRLHGVLYPQIDASAPLKRVYDTIEIPVLPVLARMEQAGVRIDIALLAQISRELAARMDELQAAVWREAGQEFNLGSPKQLQAILYDKLKLPVLGKTPKGEPSTAEDVIENLAEQHPLPRLLLDWRALQKLRSTYSEQLPLAINRRTQRIHTSYHQAVAATGRLSSADPNLQNIPARNAEGRRIRQAFIAEPGNRILSIDYSQIELRLMAHFSGDALLQDAFRQGRDIHQTTAAEVFGLSEVSADQRRAAKAINFGLIYGISAFGLARQLGIARGEAGEYMERFFGRYPGVKAYMDGSRERARRAGYVETLFGRRLHLPNINSRNQPLRSYAERIAINAPLQGTAADLIKLAMIEVQRFLDAEASEVRMIMQVHDELVFEGPATRLAEIAQSVAARMCRIVTLDVPLVTDWGLADNWDDAHHAQGHASSSG
ncbi:MAG TPA: DNA polymerase I [Solimonas sp.]|nr:DNA polymerase I [Solimonas sp.]